MDNQYYLIQYKPARSTFLQDSTEEENKIVGQHFEYLKTMHDNKELLLAGRTTDTEIGIAVFSCESIEKAQEILANDPAVANKVFIGKVSEFLLALS